MNKFLLSSTVILLVLSGYLGYKVYKSTPSQQETVKAHPVNTCTSLSYDYSKGDFEGIINYETAETLYDIYNKNKKGIASFNNEGAIVPDEDSRNIWFSLDRLKNFIWHIEQQNCENGCTDDLGLRIYFGRYPNLVEYKGATEKGLDAVPKSYSNRLTLFMVPTFKDENGHNVDFYPGGKECRTLLVNAPSHSTAELISHDITPYIMLFDMSGRTQNDQNHGTLIPPGDDTGTGFH